MRHRPDFFPVASGTGPAPTTAARRAGRPKFLPDRSLRLEEQFWQVIRFHHYAARTGESYWHWVGRFLRHHRVAGVWRHPRELREAEVVAFLSHLAMDRQVTAATQNQALHPVR